jgi:catechol 2,3-dioxygenase-like lactoylglutathione lyase family enzyme
MPYFSPVPNTHKPGLCCLRVRWFSRRWLRVSDPGYSVLGMDWKIELVAIPVTDVDRAKSFYVNQVGFNADHDYQVSESLRFVQLTPPGSACSIVMGTGITEMPPGSQRGVQVVVADVQAAREALIDHGVKASEIDVQPWGSFVTFADPDGNTWALQQVPARG